MILLRIFVVMFYCLACWGSLSSVYAQSTPDSLHPQNYYIAHIPNLPIYGPFRVSWGFVRTPYLWIQGEWIDLSRVQWPLWDFDSNPVHLVPPTAYPSTLIFEDENGVKLGEMKWTRSFSPENFDKSASSLSQKPSRFRIRQEVIPHRLFLTSSPQEFFTSKEIFHCEAEMKNNKQLQLCLSTIEKLALEANAQWYFQIRWPTVINPQERTLVHEKDREIRALLRKFKHIVQSEKFVGRTFQVRSGRTQVEKAKTISFPHSEWESLEYLNPVPDLSVERSLLLRKDFADGSYAEIFAFPGDHTQDREQSMPGFFPGQVQVQFVASDSGKWDLKRTDFYEVRTGFWSFFRPWQVAMGLSYNQLSTQRGEQNQLFNAPHFIFSYRSMFWDLIPYLYVDTGLYHPDSHLSINEMEMGIKRKLFFYPDIKLQGGYRQYSLVGKNPGTSRLGKLDAFSLGLSTDKREDRYLLRSHFLFWLTQEQGFDAQLEWGYFPKRNTDFRSYFSGFIGYARHAAQLENKNKTFEVYTEDRVQLGIRWGFMGPDQ